MVPRNGEYKNCVVCGKKFYIPRYRKKTAKYCSFVCKQMVDGFKKGHKLTYTVKPNLDPTPELAYILGVLKGDGSVFCSSQRGYTVSLYTRTEDFNRSFMNALKSIKLNPNIYHDWKRKAWLTRAFSKSFVKWYKSIKLEDIKKFLSTNEMKREFVRGFYESEGSLNRPDREYLRIMLSNTDEGLIKFVQEILQDLGFNFNFRPYKTLPARNQKAMHELNNAKQLEVSRFMGEINPCIKGIE